LVAQYIEKEEDRILTLRSSALNYIETLALRSEETEKLRKLPVETIKECRENGFFSLCQPMRYGGAELPLDAVVDILSILAGGCASTAWVCAVYADHAVLVSKMSKKATDEIWDNKPGSTISASVNPVGKVEVVEQGYSLSGKWGWASGCDSADWFLVGAFIPDDDGNNVHNLFLVPRKDIQIEDNWHVLGMKGTGSKNLIIKESIVPNYRVIRMEDANADADEISRDSIEPIYQLPQVASVPFVFAGVILGIAESLLKFITEQISQRKSMGVNLCELQSMQLHIAEISAEIDCARLLIMRDTSESMAAMRVNTALTMKQRGRNRRDMAYASRLCKSGVDRLVDIAGASGVFDDHIAQRKYRDLQVATRHIALSWDLAGTTCGEITFGLEPSSHLI